MDRKRLKSLMPYPTAKEHGQKLAKALDETNPIAKTSLIRIIQYLGLEWAEDCYHATEKVQSEGGLSVADGSRKRSFGGVFLHLAKKEMDSDQRWFIFYLPRAKAKKHKKAMQSSKKNKNQNSE